MPDLLPTHARSRGGPGTAVKLQSAFDKGLGMAGLKATKGGSGDKERAYIVRQNWVMKTVLLLIIIFAAGLIVLFSTVLKVSVSRRAQMQAEMLHHKIEHQAQVRLVRAHLELQRALEHEVHETDRLEEFHSVSDKLLGDHANKVQKLLKDNKVDEGTLKAIGKLDDELREAIEQRLGLILVHFQGVAHNARASMKRVAHAIVSDVEQEKKESDRYHNKMKSDFGVDVDEENEKEVEDAYGILKEEKGEPSHKEDDAEIARELEAFFKKLKAHAFPVVSKDVIEGWEKHMHEITQILDDNNSDIDLDRIGKQVKENIFKSAPSADPYDPAKHSSIIDYYEMRIEEAKLAFHRQELLDLYDGWKSDGKISAFTVLSGLEHIAEQNSMYLLYEWLEGGQGDVNNDHHTDQGNNNINN
mmetsp:Transcript_23679/g.37801  ORF Transcript_23679/g.37801 Transcript_23679/m.37801 type:complete len:415 (+) Transcript_23679:381-1625(+)|eukprot:CAMPEP_0203751122 /NCGR_PEP_ID=MMETSP0098-20131031/5239_1 /ASSEMBLY_ACC=CAM_ASM_000208 /TAXON_ID=96639 /ORGANISM=" , Strain NY0313808BC1" /LENGTH=414 /DNA_ID=CAMNT_0050640699 /DNA_START=200 /DNA_END=1444 /DNA_ORIENTATION=-